MLVWFSSSKKLSHVDKPTQSTAKLLLNLKYSSLKWPRGAVKYLLNQWIQWDLNNEHLNNGNI